MIQLYKEYKDCCGCGACEQICPHHAISLNANSEGFIFPQINTALCTNCGVCIKTCNFEKAIINTPQKVIAASWNSWQIKNSASGGLFATMAKYILMNKGIVYGCSMEKKEKLTPFIRRIKDINEIILLQGSKYVQSFVGESYIDVRDNLKKGKIVLYSGTPCQIAGLYGFLQGKSYKNLTTIDIICHGVPSAKMFQEYIAYLENKKHINIHDFKFRTKTKGWGLYYYYYYTNKQGKEKQYINHYTSSIYYRMFLEGAIYRESCYNCPFARKERVADITIGDCWGIEKEYPNLLTENGGVFDSHKGISLVLLNTSKGYNLFNQLTDIEKKDIALDNIARYNQQLNHPSILPSYRKAYLQCFKKDGYKALQKLYLKDNKKVLLKENLSKFMPISLKRIIKSSLRYKLL